MRGPRDQEEARRLWRRALALYADIDAPEADDIRERLSAPADPTAPAEDWPAFHPSL